MTNMEWHWRKTKVMKYMCNILLGKNTDDSDKKKKGGLNHALLFSIHPSPPCWVPGSWPAPKGPLASRLPPGFRACEWGWAIYFLHFLSVGLLPAGCVSRGSTEGHSSVKQASPQSSLSTGSGNHFLPHPTGLGWEWGLPWGAVPSFAHMLQIVPSYTLFKLLSLRVSSFLLKPWVVQL